MLNAKNERELCYVVQINAIEPIVGSDNCEAAVVGGWRVMTRKGTFVPGAAAIYFEIDSKVDETKPEFAFMERYHGKVKTQRYTFGGKGLMISQGLLMHPSDFGWDGQVLESNCATVIEEDGVTVHKVDDESRFLTKRLGVTYAVAEDNARKAGSMDKYKKMAQRNGKLFSKQPFRWLMRRNWGKKLLFVFFGKRGDSHHGFPTHFPYIKKSDEERIENMPYILESKESWIKTLKIDGTSSTYILERKKFRKNEYYVCSRNVRQLTEDQKTYHTTNVYWDNSNKYHIREFLEDQLTKHPDWSYVCIQGESAGIGIDGAGIQGNPHKLNDLYFFGFNFIDSKNGRWNSIEAAKLCAEYNIPWVPILDENYILPDNMEAMKLSADGPCDIPNSKGLREGFVYRSLDGTKSFKNVSRQYLLSQKN